MQEGERDRLEVLIFDEIEETVGTWLRTIIQRLEKEQKAIQRHHPQRSTPSGKTLRRTLSYQKHDPKLELGTLSQGFQRKSAKATSE